MKDLFTATIIEFKKLKRSTIILIVFLVFSFIPLIGGIFMYLLKNPNLIPDTSILKIKVSMLSTPVDWSSYLGTFVAQGAGIVGIIAYGFIISYLFGREYTDKTYKNILCLPVSRFNILNAKFIVYLLLCLFFAVWDLLFSFIIGSILNLPGWDLAIMTKIAKLYIITSFLAISLGTIISFFALWSRGYLAPLGFLIIMLFFANIAPYLGVAQYFPWSIPVLFSGAAGEELRNNLNFLSYICLATTSLSGYLLTIAWWNYSDQY